MMNICCFTDVLADLQANGCSFHRNNKVSDDDSINIFNINSILNIQLLILLIVDIEYQIS